MELRRPLLALAVLAAVMTTVSCDDIFDRFPFPFAFPRIPRIEMRPIRIPNIDPEQIQNLKPGPGQHVSGFSFVSHADSDGSGGTLVTNVDGEVKVHKIGDHAKQGTETHEIPAIPDTPDIPEIPSIPDIPSNPEIPEMPEIPDLPPIPEIPPIPPIPSFPEIPAMPLIPPINIDPEEMQNQKSGLGQHVSGWSYVAHSDDSGSGSTLLTNNDGEVNIYKTGDHADDN